MPHRRGLALACLFLLMLWTGCGTNSTTSGTESNTNTQAAITVSVTPLSPSVQTGNTQQFTATVANTTNTAVNWQVNGVAGGNATVGTISSGGLYTAPATVPTPATVTVTAVSQADTSKSASTSVTVTAPPAITVTVAPSNPSVTVGNTQQFTATVANTANTAVTWQVNDVTGGNANVGTITVAGLYTAPATVPNPATVTVKAISAADNTKNGTATVTVTAPAPVARFAYVSAFPDDKIAIYSVNDTTGLLTPSTTASLAAGSGPSFVAMHPTGKFLYSLNKGANNIAIFTVNTTTGGLTSAGTVATPSGPHYLVFSPSGNFAFVTCDNAGSVAAFSVNTTTGALTAVAGSPFAVGGTIRGLAITPDFKYLYVSDRNGTPSAITGFTINTSTGVLTKMATPFSGDAIGTMVVDKAGKFLYAGSPDDTNVSGYSINSTTGALTFVADYPAGTTTSVWTFDSTGTYLYGGSTGNNNLFTFKENANGSLTAVGSPVSVAVLPNGGGLHPNGKFLYAVSTISEVALAQGTITIYSVSSTTGALTLVNSTPAGVNNTIGLAITP